MWQMLRRGWFCEFLTVRESPGMRKTKRLWQRQIGKISGLRTSRVSESGGCGPKLQVAVAARFAEAGTCAGCTSCGVRVRCLRLIPSHAGGEGDALAPTKPSLSFLRQLYALALDLAPSLDITTMPAHGFGDEAEIMMQLEEYIRESVVLAGMGLLLRRWSCVQDGSCL